MFPEQFIKIYEEEDYYSYPNCGFLIVNKYEMLVSKYKERYTFENPIYAIQGNNKNKSNIKYRGIDRDAISPYKDSNNLAEIRLAELEESEDCIDGILWNINDVENVISFLDDKNNYEIIWARINGYNVNPPKEFVSIGFEATYFVGDHFSASCDCMMFPRWHGTDEKGVLFRDYYEKLNENGLFENAIIAKEFLEYYLSIDWTERGNYEIVEIFTFNE